MMCIDPLGQFLAVAVFVCAVLTGWLFGRRHIGSYRRRLDVLTRSHGDMVEAAEVAERRLAQLGQAKDAMFELVARIERQRDEWSAMHMSDSVTHAATAAVYDRELKRERVRIYHLLQSLNRYREAKGKPPIKTPKHLDSELGINALPVGLVTEYVEELKQHYTKGHPDFRAEREYADRPADIDGKAERAQLLVWLDEQVESEEASA